MKNSNIRKAVERSFIGIDGIEPEDRLIISCILYNYIRQVVERESSEGNSLNQLAQTYFNSIQRNFYEFKVKYVSYTSMLDYLKSLNKNSFLSFSDNNIQEILRLYQERTEIKSFSITYFSQYMYKIINLNMKQYQYLSKVHWEIMVPIVKYYMDTEGIHDSDIRIHSISGGTPGKEVIFSIEGIKSPKILVDIRQNRIFNSENVSVSLDRGNVRIINK